MTVDMIPWVLSRAAGIVAYLLLAGAMAAGLVTRSRIRLPGMRAADTVDLHRRLTVAALVAVGVHGLALLLDPVVAVSPLALVVPGMVPYRPVWTAAGVLALWALAVVQISSLARRRIGVRAWRALHMTAYGAFVLATAHGIVAGTDTGRGWVVAMYGGATALVAGLTGYRAAAARRPPARARRVREDGAVTAAPTTPAR